MNKVYPFPELQQKISEAQKILLALPPQPSFDKVASALSLFLSLQTSGKTVFVVCPSPMTVEYNHLVGVDKITDKVEGSDLIISFNYPAEQIEKVSYNDDNNQPNLVIQVKPGAPKLSEKLARFSYSGADVDLIFSFGIKDPNRLSQYFSNSSPAIVYLDTDPNVSPYGQINIIDPQSSSFSEIVLGIISGLGLPLEIDTAQNILSGIWNQTNSLTSPKVSADTYESVAICLRLGALKPQNFSQPRKQIFSPPQKQKKKDIKPEAKTSSVPEESPQNPPPDWFEPKIFKSNTNI